MLTDLKNYLVGLLGGVVAVFIAVLVTFAYMNIFVWHTAGMENSGYDIISLFVHFSSMPVVWIATLIIFGVGFYVPLRRQRAKSDGPR